MTEKAKLREALERIVDWVNGMPGAISEDLALLRAHLDSLPESEPGEAEAALERMRGWAHVAVESDREDMDGGHEDVEQAALLVRAALRAAAGPDAETRRRAWEAWHKAVRSRNNPTTKVMLHWLDAIRAGLWPEEGGDA